MREGPSLSVVGSCDGCEHQEAGWSCTEPAVVEVRSEGERFTGGVTPAWCPFLGEAKRKLAEGMR